MSAAKAQLREAQLAFNRARDLYSRQIASKAAFDQAEATRLFGYPSVPLLTLVDWTADWVGRGLPSLGKDTHYDTRDGNF